MEWTIIAAMVIAFGVWVVKVIQGLYDSHFPTAQVNDCLPPVAADASQCGPEEDDISAPTTQWLEPNATSPECLTGLWPARKKPSGDACPVCGNPLYERHNGTILFCDWCNFRTRAIDRKSVV